MSNTWESALNWEPLSKKATLTVWRKGKGLPSWQYKTTFRVETAKEANELHEEMQKWPEQTYFVDEKVNEIRFINDKKFPSISVEKVQVFNKQ